MTRKFFLLILSHPTIWLPIFHTMESLVNVKIYFFHVSKLLLRYSSSKQRVLGTRQGCFCNFWRTRLSNDVLFRIEGAISMAYFIQFHTVQLLISLFIALITGVDKGNFRVHVYHKVSQQLSQDSLLFVDFKLIRD